MENPQPGDRTVSLVTLGCARNEVDSEELAGRLDAAGWTLAGDDDAGEAKVVLVNTCGFIEAAKQESIAELLGAASGILFGVSDVAIKALTGIVGAHGVLGLASPWLAITVVASIGPPRLVAQAMSKNCRALIVSQTTARTVIGRTAGRITCQNTPNLPAPSMRAASL